MEVGQFESDIHFNMVVENRRIRDVLLAKGYEVTYSEYNGGHDMVCWRGSLADGLIALAGKGAKK
jgi:enterochelin esterase-like enzyme